MYLSGTPLAGRSEIWDQYPTLLLGEVRNLTSSPPPPLPNLTGLSGIVSNNSHGNAVPKSNTIPGHQISEAKAFRDQRAERRRARQAKPPQRRRRRDYTMDHSEKVLGKPGPTSTALRVVPSLSRSHRNPRSPHPGAVSLETCCRLPSGWCSPPMRPHPLLGMFQWAHCCSRRDGPGWPEILSMLQV